MIKFHCSHCQQRISALEEEVGVVGSCPNCEHPIIIPPVSDAEPEPAPASGTPSEIDSWDDEDAEPEYYYENRVAVARVPEDGERDLGASEDRSQKPEPEPEPEPEPKPEPKPEPEPESEPEPPKPRVSPRIAALLKPAPPAALTPEGSLDELIEPDPEPVFSSQAHPAPPPTGAAAASSRKFDPNPPEPEPAPSRKFDPAAEDDGPPPPTTAAGTLPPSRPGSRFDPGTADELPPPEPAETPARIEGMLSPVEAILVALGFNAALVMALFSLWTEYGPYAWLGALQIQFLGQYHPVPTLIATVVIWAIPILLLHRVASLGGRLASLLANSLGGMVLATHLGLAVYFVAVAGYAPPVDSLATAAREATFLSRQVSLTPDHILLLNQRQMQELVASARVRSYEADAKPPAQRQLFIPFYPSQWANEATPVLLAITKASLESHQTRPSNITGTIRKRPLPYRARLTLPASMPLFCVVLTEYESVRAPWIVALIVDIAIALYVLRNLWQRRKHQAVSPSPPTPRSDSD